MRFQVNGKYRLHGVDRTQQMPLEVEVESFDEATGLLRARTGDGKRLTVDTTDPRVYATGGNGMSPTEMGRRGLL